MGYRGFEEYLCEDGHYQTGDARSNNATCEFCDKPITHRHSVDTTNGYREEHAACCNAPKTEIGFDDVWFYDHYGARYAVKRVRFSPDLTVWIDCVEERRKIEEENRLNKENERYSIQWINTENNVWKTLNEFDFESCTFKFLDDVRDVSLVHEFKLFDDAKRALRIIRKVLEADDPEFLLSKQHLEVFRYDIRHF